MEAQRRGKRVVLASGRPTMGVTPLAQELCLGDHHGFILSFNGGTMIDCASGETIFSRMLPAESNQRIMELADENQVAFLTYEGERLLTNDAECPYCMLESKINHAPLVEIEDIRSYLTFEVPKRWVKVNAGPVYTEEQRQAMKERARAISTSKSSTAVE